MQVAASKLPRVAFKNCIKVVSIKMSNWEVSKHFKYGIKDKLDA